MRVLRAFLACSALLLVGVPLSAQSTVVVLVRHAEEAEPDAQNSVLSAAGVARTDSLVAALQHVKLDAVYTTQFIRTKDTGAALAKGHGVALTVVEARRGFVEAFAQRLRAEHRGQTVLVVGHSNTTPQLIRALGGPQLPDIAEEEHARFFVLVLDEDGGARLLDARYGVR